MVLLAAFLTSQGRALTEAAVTVGTTTSKYQFDDRQSQIGLTRGLADYENALQNLRTDGYAILPCRLDADVVRRLTDQLSHGQMTLISDDHLLDESHATLDLQNPQAEKYDVPLDSILGSPDACRLMLDGGVLAIAQDYLGGPPILDICAAWFSFPVNRASARAATMFHFDLDRVRWMKVFFFLTDVDPNTGSHVFIPRTQQDGAIPTQLLKNGYDRLSDADVESEFPRNEWEFLGGPRGTVLIEDTRGLHKGLPVLSGHRLVLQFQYSIDLFGSRCSLSNAEAPKNDEWVSFRERYPRVLSAFECP